jgi:hypothetical protein
LDDGVAAGVAEVRLIRVLEEWWQSFTRYHLYCPSHCQPVAAFTLLINALRFAGAQTGVIREAIRRFSCRLETKSARPLRPLRHRTGWRVGAVGHLYDQRTRSDRTHLNLLTVSRRREIP